MVDSTELTERQRDLVGAFVRAWLANEAGDAFQPFHFASQGSFEHSNWPEEVQVPDREEVRPLVHLGLLDPSQPGLGEWVVSPTPAAVDIAHEIGQVLARHAPFPPDLQWHDMVRVLETVLTLYQHELSPGHGARLGDVAGSLGCLANDSNLVRAILLLHEDNYLMVNESNPPESSSVIPRPRTLQLLRDWPSAEPELVATRLDEALAAAIERTNDPIEKTKLQQLRSSAGEVTKSVLAGAILTAGKAAAGV